MLSSEKAIFENYNCGDPSQRQNAAVMVKAMHQNGLHDILPVLYKVASILTTIPATSCSAERSFSALRRIVVGARDERHESEANEASVFCFDNASPEKSCFLDGLVCFISLYLRVFEFLNATRRE